LKARAFARLDWRRVIPGKPPLSPCLNAGSIAIVPAMVKHRYLLLFVLLWLPMQFGAVADGVLVNTENYSFPSPEEMNQWKLSYHSLEDWIARTSRKEWKLLYKSETKEHYAAVYLDGQERIVVETWRLNGLTPNSSTLDITGEDGTDACKSDGIGYVKQKVNVSSLPQLDSKGRLSTASGSYELVIGEIRMLGKNCKGKIHIVKHEHLKEGDGPLEVLDYTLQWPVSK
jgi:hypothetical protein